MKIEFLEEGSADCPLIRIFGTVRHQFVALHSETLKLGQGLGLRCVLHELPDFAGVDGCAFSAVSSSADQGARRASKAPQFVWGLTPRMWMIVSGLIEPFALAPRIGAFQWLGGPEAGHGLDVGEVNILLSCSQSGSW